jgi:hypothetical protein
VLNWDRFLYHPTRLIGFIQNSTKFGNRDMSKNDLEKEDYYLSEDGFIIFKESYHLKRGYCCQSGCKHCPYGYDNRTGKFNRK